MKILYAAIDQRVPGTTGGSVHVAAVANGLAALGHDVHVLTNCQPAPAQPGSPAWHDMGPVLGAKQLRFLSASRVTSLARELKPDAVIERYYNFGGEGVLAAKRIGAVAVLEVNAPIIDYRGSPKQWLDRAVLAEPMRRWRDWQCRNVDLIVTPTAAIIPTFVPRDRVVEIEWGADTTRFHPGATGAVPFPRTSGSTVAVFAGAFRRWHGAIHLVRALNQLHQRSRRDIHGVLIGDGPELPSTQQAAQTTDLIRFTGAIAHEAMPSALAAADLGVAPFDVEAHPSLALDFYWSPLKIFEYMASGLPVVAPDIPRLRKLVTHEQDALLYDARDAKALARAIERLADDPALRKRLGSAAREKVVREFSWATHCRRLSDAIERCAS